MKLKTKIMGVLNVNSDSFFSKSRIGKLHAQEKIEQMITEGADIIDIGGLSSRPGSQSISDDDELFRIKGIIDLIYEKKYFETIKFSLDSYSPVCLDYALRHGFHIVNDITGLRNDDVCKVAKKYSAEVCIMHMQNSPENMQDNPVYCDVLKEVDDFFKQRIEKAKSFDIKNIILDVGIGFGKTVKHNLKLIKNQSYFSHFGYPILIGASRKSLIDNICSSSVEDRLPGTLILHVEAVRNGANIIRCHDVKEHIQALSVFEKLGNSYYEK